MFTRESAVDHRPPAEPPARPADLPSISDYWPDAPHRMGPAADWFDTSAAPAAPVQAPAPRPGAEPARRGGRTAAVVILTLGLIGAVGVGTTIALRSAATPEEAPPPGASIVPSAPTASPESEGVLTAPLGDRDAAAFELVSDASLVELSTADLGGDLYRISAPQGSSVQPRIADDDGTVRLFLDPVGRPGDEEVEVVLTTAVPWRLTVSGGIRRANLDLAGADVAGVTLAGDAARIDLTLPRPDGTLPIRMSGGINRFEVRTDRGVPVRIRTRGGAGEVTFDGRTKDGVASGANFQNREWPASEDRVDVDAVVGVGTLTLGRS